MKSWILPKEALLLPPEISQLHAAASSRSWAFRKVLGKAIRLSDKPPQLLSCTVPDHHATAFSWRAITLPLKNQAKPELSSYLWFMAISLLKSIGARKSLVFGAIHSPKSKPEIVPWICQNSAVKSGAGTHKLLPPTHLTSHQGHPTIVCGRTRPFFGRGLQPRPSTPAGNLATSQQAREPLCAPGMPCL